MPRPLCQKCKRVHVEVIDDWESNYCGRCNDRMIERSNKQREWDHYHPGEPAPESELGDEEADCLGLYEFYQSGRPKGC